MAHGDVLVIGTDGVWDNIPKASVQRRVVAQDSLKTLADELACEAFRRSHMKEYSSPFYEKATACGVPCPRKGKEDDITVVTARVVVSVA